MPRLKWLMFQMPMSSPHRMRILGLSVFAMPFSFRLAVNCDRDLRPGGSITSALYCATLLAHLDEFDSGPASAASPVALADLAAEDPVDADRVDGDDRQDHDAAVEQEMQ